MRKRVENNKMACGRTEEDYYKCCMNSDHTWKSNRLKFTKFQIALHPHTHRPIVRIHYEIVCRKCGHTRQSGNCFGLPVIKELLTGSMWF